MYKNTLLLLLFLTNCLSRSYSQNNKREDIFYESLLSVYKKVAEPEVTNIFELLNHTAKYSFTSFNTSFKPALEEIVLSKKKTEIDALRILFTNSFAKLRMHNLWDFNIPLYESNKKLFSIYNDSFCPCLNENISDFERIEKINAALQKCTPKLMTDTSFINKLRKEAGDSTLNSLYKLQQFYVLSLYQSCNSIHKTFDNSFFQLGCTEAYFMSINEDKIQLGQMLLKYYRANNIDSILKIFPTYKTKGKDLKKYHKLINDNNVTKRVFPRESYANKNPTFIINFVQANKHIGSVECEVTKGLINLRILQAKYLPVKPINKKDMIEEVIIGEAPPLKTK